MGKTERFSLTFTVNDFSKVKTDLLSPPVIAQNLKWRIKIKPDYHGHGPDGQQERVLGYYLQCDGVEGGSNKSYWSCQVTASLRVISVKKGVDNVSEEFSHLYNSMEYWGYPCFMNWEDVKSIERGLIEDDSVTFLVVVMADEPQRCKRCEERTCKVCLKEEVGVLFDPCGHVATCTKCSSDLKECPICRGVINKKIRAFL